jgi:hypothetical protein
MEPLYCEVCLIPVDRDIVMKIVKTSTLFDTLQNMLYFDRLIENLYDNISHIIYLRKILNMIK